MDHETGDLLVGRAVLAGLFTTQAFARIRTGGRRSTAEPYRHVAHPGMHPRHGGFDAPRHHGYAYPRGYPHGVSPFVPRPPIYGPPAVIYPYWGYPPIYPRHRHVCGPGLRVWYPSGFYYRGNGWGLSFSF